MKEKIPFDAYDYSSDYIDSFSDVNQSSERLDIVLDLAVVACLVIIVMYVVFSLMLGLTII